MKKIFIILIFVISFPAISESWKYEGEVLHPNCFQTEWLSSDNMQEFYETFMDAEENYYNSKEYEDFSLNIGRYWGKEIKNYEPIKASWGEKIELAVSMKSCLKKTTPRFEERDQWTISSNETYEYSYKVLRRISLEQCQLLAPNLEGKCLQSYLLQIRNWGGGSMTWGTSQIFGLFEMPNKEKYIFPLKKIKSQDVIEIK